MKTRQKEKKRKKEGNHCLLFLFAEMAKMR